MERLFGLYPGVRDRYLAQGRVVLPHFRPTAPVSGQFISTSMRANKRGGAWMDECMSRKQTAQGTTPTAYLTCNLSPPVGDKPALFTTTSHYAVP
jgi:oligopeptidase A